jgi:hypothetical protein
LENEKFSHVFAVNKSKLANVQKKTSAKVCESLSMACGEESF